MPNMTLVTRPYGETYDRFIALGPLTRDLGTGAKGIVWDSKEEVEALGRINGETDNQEPYPKLETARQASQTILTLAPETNGHVAVKAWEALSQRTGRSTSIWPKGGLRSGSHSMTWLRSPGRSSPRPLGAASSRKRSPTPGAIPTSRS